ncbi:MAG: L-glutamate gamma-semialdehyde dehydrogenase [Actinomycetota bacterium]
MGAGEFSVVRPPVPVNEPVRDYAPGSPERERLLATLKAMESERQEAPLVIGDSEVRSGDLYEQVLPHRTSHVLADVHRVRTRDVNAAIQAAADAHSEWASTPWQDRAAIFLRAAELLSGPWRDRVNAATMLGQSKTVHQAEIDAACELIDFWRFNVAFMHQIYAEQPMSAPGTWNALDYRPLEGFLLAISPFNFTSIAGNLASSCALMGNVVLWKPAVTASYSAQLLMELMIEAGLPPGVINLLHGDGRVVGDVVFEHPDFAGLHFTGSTTVFKHLWGEIGAHIDTYRNYPRIVGETGGKDFIVAHPSADAEQVATAVLRGSFEYQGQKCSAASRIYVPSNLWGEVSERLAAGVRDIRMGDVSDLSNFMGAVIDDRALAKHRGAIDHAGRSPNAEIIAGGGVDDSEGYFVEPTIVRTEDPGSKLLSEEFFGPIVSAYVYDDTKYSDTLALIDRTSPYALTGAIFSSDRAAVAQARDVLRYAAGNFYINDKPTGAVVGQQPFGGARGSGTDDKAGSMWNLIRWVAPRTIKETFVPPTDYRYPYLDDA